MIFLPSDCFKNSTLAEKQLSLCSNTRPASSVFDSFWVSLLAVGAAGVTGTCVSRGARAAGLPSVGGVPGALGSSGTCLRASPRRRTALEVCKTSACTWTACGHVDTFQVQWLQQKSSPCGTERWPFTAYCVVGPFNRKLYTSLPTNENFFWNVCDIILSYLRL